MRCLNKQGGVCITKFKHLVCILVSLIGRTKNELSVIFLCIFSALICEIEELTGLLGGTVKYSLVLEYTNTNKSLTSRQPCLKRSSSEASLLDIQKQLDCPFP